MNEIFERHAERLSSGERRGIWEAIAASRATSQRPGPRLARLAAAVAASIVAIVVFQMRPTDVMRTATVVEGGATTSNGLSAGDRDRVLPDSQRDGANSVKAAPPVPAVAVPSTKGDAPPVVDESRSKHESQSPSTRLPIAALRRVAQGAPNAAAPASPITGNTGAVVGRITDAHDPAPMVMRSMEEVSVRAERRLDLRSSTTKQSLSAEKLKELPVDHLSQLVGSKAGVVERGGDLHFRGGRGGEVKIQIDGSAYRPSAPPVVPTTGGTRLPNDEAFDSMFFKNHGVNPFIATDEDALSTFAVDVDAASYTVMRRYIGLGHLPPAAAVRVEEFVNFFPQDYPRFEDGDFRIMIDAAPSPFGAGYHLLRVGLKGREIVERDRKPAQLTFVIDVSGSMAREDRLELVKRALRILVDGLRGDDQVGIVVFGNQGRVLLEPAALGGRADDRGGRVAAGRRRILDAIDNLRPEGSTNAEHGLRLGYEMARRGYRSGALNRIVLCSDGVANVGHTGPGSILAQVRSEADRGIHLTTIGFGMGNYNDVLMEQLADQGDGNHYYVDDIDEARRVFVENLTGTLQTIARDAKVQVEFDSTRVVRYRLLGFEDRDVADRDFRNDKIDAGEIGAGHEVTALYEVKLAPGIDRGTLGTVRLRYAEPEHDAAGAQRVREIERRFDVAAIHRRFEDASPRFRLDAAVAEFAEILRGSYWARESRLSDVLSVARSAARGLRDDTSAELVSLVEKASALSLRSTPVKPDEDK